MMNRKIFIFLIIILLLAIFGESLYFLKIKPKNFLSEEKAEKIVEKAIKYINKNLVPPGYSATLVSFKILPSKLIEIKIKIQNEEFLSYISLDGKYLFPAGFLLEEELVQKKQEKLVKKNVVDVKIFVMSYCPFGNQMLKAFLPVYSLLKEKVNFSIHFVDYIMHGKEEIEENLRQYCLQKIDQEKYINYLSCFLKAGEGKKCFEKITLQKDLYEKCLNETDKKFKVWKRYEDRSSWLGGNYPPFEVEKDLNEKYNISGSPTVIINENQIEVSPRSPERLKELVCQAFKTPPSECHQKLKEEIPKPGFGFESGGGEIGGICK